VQERKPVPQLDQCQAPPGLYNSNQHGNDVRDDDDDDEEAAAACCLICTFCGFCMSEIAEIAVACA
jgi:hypothetical protein